MKLACGLFSGMYSSSWQSRVISSAVSSPGSPLTSALCQEQAESHGRSPGTQRGLGRMVLLECPLTNLLEGCWQFSLFSTTPLFLIIVYNCICFTCLSSKWVDPTVHSHC